jgi:hypothetical protein
VLWQGERYLEPKKPSAYTFGAHDIVVRADLEAERLRLLAHLECLAHIQANRMVHR